MANEDGTEGERGAGINVQVHPHASERLRERGATEQEIISTVLDGERFPAKLGRTGFRRNFAFGDTWRGKHYATKQVEAIAVNRGRRLARADGSDEVLLEDRLR